MATTVVHHERSGKCEPETEAGPLLRLLLRRRGLVLLASLLLMILAGVAGRDVGDKLTSGAYLDPSAESHRVDELPSRARARSAPRRQWSPRSS